MQRKLNSIALLLIFWRNYVSSDYEISTLYHPNGGTMPELFLYDEPIDRIMMKNVESYRITVSDDNSIFPKLISNKLSIYAIVCSFLFDP